MTMLLCTGYFDLKAYLVHGYNSIPMLAPSCVNYSKVVPKLIHLVIRQRPFLEKSNELRTLKTKFIFYHCGSI